MRQPSASQQVPGSRRGRVTVGLGELRVSEASGPTLATDPLGASVVVVAFDAEAQIGGILHFMLPDSSLDPDRGSNQPELFADTGIEQLLESMVRRGGDPRRMSIFLVGGADPAIDSDDSESGSLGARNLAKAREELDRRDVKITDERTGGTVSRSVAVDVASKRVIVRHPQNEEDLL